MQPLQNIEEEQLAELTVLDVGEDAADIIKPVSPNANIMEPSSPNAIEPENEMVLLENTVPESPIHQHGK